MESDTAAAPPPAPPVFEIETTRSERIAAIRAVQRWIRAYARESRFSPPSLLLMAVIAFTITLAFHLFSWSSRDAALPWALVLIFFLIFLSTAASISIQQRRLITLAAEETDGHFSLHPGEQGLAVRASSGSGEEIPWSAIRGLERHHDAIAIYLRAFRVLWLPLRCIPDETARNSLIRELETRTGLTLRNASTAPPAATAQSGASSRESSPFLRALRDNLRAGVRFLLFRKSAPTLLRGTVPQYIALCLLNDATGLAFDLLHVGWEGEFNRWAIPWLLWGIPLILLCAWCCGRLGDTAARAMDGAVAIMAITCLAYPMQAALPFLPEAFWRQLGPASEWVGWLLLTWFVLANGIALGRIYRLRPPRYAVAMAAVITTLILPGFLLQNDNDHLWVERYDPDQNAAAIARREQARSETVLYRQPALLEQALAGLREQRPGVPDIYLIAMGGNGGQDVFLHETLSVDALFEERFDTAGRSVVLVNNPATAQERPIASVTALQRALDAAAARMDKDEDVLFLFMTSHGSQDFRFDLSLWPYRFEELTPQRLREMLDASGIRNRVIVVSACYSGGFVEPLADERTLVMSAARADRNSHGCSHEADWTFFGRAYFDEALRHTYSFSEAFAQARQAVTEREAAQGYEASEPQIAEGEKIRPVLEKIGQRLAAREKTHAAAP